MPTQVFSLTLSFHIYQALDDKEQYLCGENTSPVTHWECTTELRAQLALLVSTGEIVTSHHQRQRLPSAEDAKPERQEGRQRYHSRSVLLAWDRGIPQ